MTWMRTFPTLLLVILISQAMSAADTTPLTPAAKRAQEACSEQVAKLRDQYQAACQKEVAKLEQGLQTELSNETKRGNLDNALAIKAIVDEIKSGAYMRKLMEAAADGNLLGETRILIKADAVTARGPNGGFGGAYPEMLWTTGAGGVYDIPVQLPSGTYYLVALKAANEARPCRVSINGKVLGEAFFKEVTGGWTADLAKPERAGPFEADGKTTIRIQPQGFSPHFYGFLITSDAKAALAVSDFKPAK